MGSIRKTHRQHEGELLVQRRRGAPAEQSSYIAGAIRDEMSPQHIEFYRRLPFLPLAALDAEGRPWATLLCNPRITAPDSERLQISARVNPRDPFVDAVRAPSLHARQFAAVAIDLSRRLRVKIAGQVDAADLDAAGDLTLALHTNEHMGNCPKYITARKLRPKPRTPETRAHRGRLPSEAKALLERVSTLFIATRHVAGDPRESDMGLNHRGGPNGFVRYLENEAGAFLVLPDYSGNRFYQSLGNVETDPVMGVALPDFATGELLQVSGRARNLFDEEAAALMPGASLLTLISVEQAFFTRGALDLELAGEEQPSPYNPKVRRLATESPASRNGFERRARLVGIRKESARISSFTFELPEPAPDGLLPGGHAIFDFSKNVERGYQHMNDADPQSLNDDCIRAYTVSDITPDRRSIAITVKKSGVISSYLHALELRSGGDPIEVDLKGFGGEFTCFEEGKPLPEMIWVAGGVGITPFLAMYRALRRSGQPMPDIELFYSCRDDELELIRELAGIKLRVFVSRSKGAAAATAPVQLHRRRQQETDFPDRQALERKTIFVCGPSGLMAAVKSWLEDKVEPARLRFESFTF